MDKDGNFIRWDEICVSVYHKKIIWVLLDIWDELMIETIYTIILGIIYEKALLSILDLIDHKHVIVIQTVPLNITIGF